MRLFDLERTLHISSEETYGAFRYEPVDEDHPGPKGLGNLRRRKARALPATHDEYAVTRGNAEPLDHGAIGGAPSGTCAGTRWMPSSGPKSAGISRTRPCC